MVCGRDCGVVSSRVDALTGRHYLGWGIWEVQQRGQKESRGKYSVQARLCRASTHKQARSESGQPGERLPRDARPEPQQSVRKARELSLHRVFR